MKQLIVKGVYIQQKIFLIIIRQKNIIILVTLQIIIIIIMMMMMKMIMGEIKEMIINTKIIKEMI